MLYVPTVAQAKIYDPDGAATAGLIDSVVDEGEAISTAMDAAAQLAQLPGKAYAGNKLGMRQAALEIMATDL